VGMLSSMKNMILISKVDQQQRQTDFLMMMGSTTIPEEMFQIKMFFYYNAFGIIGSTVSSELNPDESEWHFSEKMVYSYKSIQLSYVVKSNHYSRTINLKKAQKNGILEVNLP
jgi:hypothetical protein